MPRANGQVTGVAQLDDGLCLVVHVEGQQGTDVVRLSHEMQRRVLDAITERWSNKASQLAWREAGHPVPLTEMD